MRTTLTLPDEVHTAVKVLAEASGRPISEVVTELVRRALRSETVPAPADGMPVFAIASGSEMIPGSRASELLADEGVE